MCASILNRKGTSLVEVCVALFLLGMGIFALISLQPPAWRLSGKSDCLGRASGILLAQLQAVEAKIMNPNLALPANDRSTVYPGGQSTAKPGDLAFPVSTTITDLGNNTWQVTVRVTWPGSTTGISQSMIVTRQPSFAQ
jgi:Tfp pilus assembly protein PilV